jgi:hypothetical protein
VPSAATVGCSINLNWLGSFKGCVLAGQTLLISATLT